jgi:hypothetical protein
VTHLWCLCYSLPPRHSLTQPSISRSILPPMPPNTHHPNRRVILHRLVPLPPNHCHSPNANRHSFCHIATLSQMLISRSILPLPHSNRHHPNRHPILHRLVPLPPNHCHSLNVTAQVQDRRAGRDRREPRRGPPHGLPLLLGLGHGRDGAGDVCGGVAVCGRGGVRGGGFGGLF